LDLSVIILAGIATSDLDVLLPMIREALTSLAISHETIVVSNRPDEDIRRLVRDHRARLLITQSEAYGAALLLGFQQAAGQYIFVMEGDQTRSVDFLRDLWEARRKADIVIASRYVLGGQAHMPRLRLVLSRLLNIVFSRGLDLKVRDMSSGFRLYRTDILRGLSIQSKDYNILQEILVKAMMEGYRISEIPFVYHAQSSRSAYKRIFKFGSAYGKTFAFLWRLRNSISSADYDARAFDALMPPQRYWQRKRYKLITDLVRGRGRCLDVGCGSSRIIEALPHGSVALDILMRKLRFARSYGVDTVQGSIFNLPVPAGSFPCIICSQVIEHVQRTEPFYELDRVLEPGGFLILGTPDYARWQWRVIEWLYKLILPQAYADEHITHYTYHDLYHEFVDQRGYALEAVWYILQGELIMGLRKPFQDGRSMKRG
jgi:dolichol-phosphate mannosyltransferase